MHFQQHQYLVPRRMANDTMMWFKNENRQDEKGKSGQKLKEHYIDVNIHRKKVVPQQVGKQKS